MELNNFLKEKVNLKEYKRSGTRNMDIIILLFLVLMFTYLKENA